MLRESDQRELRTFALRLAAAAGMLWLLFGVVFGLAAVPGGDMTPTAEGGDLLLYYRPQTLWRTGDLAVVRAEGKTLLGRVAARGGDTVEITAEGRLMVNGRLVAEPNIHTATPPYPDVDYPLTLQERELFLLADRREGGVDSRRYGPADPAMVRGKVLLILRRSQL